VSDKEWPRIHIPYPSAAGRTKPNHPDLHYVYGQGPHPNNDRLSDAMKYCRQTWKQEPRGSRFA
jgi:hypothetical protein